MELEEFKEVYNNFIREHGTTCSPTQANDLETIFYSSEGDGVPNLTVNQAKLITRAYFIGYSSGSQNP